MIQSLQCIKDGHLFEDSTVTRYFLTCFHKKWNVSEPSLCPDNLQSCTKPKIPSCSLKGCNKLEPPSLKRISYEPDLGGYFTGSTLTISCNNNNTPFTVFQDFDDSNKVFAITSPEYNAQSKEILTLENVEETAKIKFQHFQLSRNFEECKGAFNHTQKRLKMPNFDST